MTDLTPEQRRVYERVAKHNGTTVEQEVERARQSKIVTDLAPDKRAPLIYEATVRTHDQQVERSLKQIAVFTGIVAVTVIVGLVASFLTGIAATASLY